MRSFLKGLAWVVGTLAVLVLIARIALVRTWTVPDDPALNASLAPTLFGGDLVVVLFRGERRFGQLVRCPDPEDPQRWVVGRIVGLQGDKIRVEGSSITVNGKRYDTTEACTEGKITVPHPTDGRPIEHACSRVEIAGGWHYMALAMNATPEGPQEHTVGPGRVFLLSDNRTYHDDSRDFGAVPADSCTEQILFRLWGKEGFFDEERRFTTIR